MGGISHEDAKTHDALVIRGESQAADDYGLISPVLSVEEFELQGGRFLRVRVILAPHGSTDIELDVYVGEPAHKGIRPIVPGCYLQAVVWLQGFPVHEAKHTD